MNECTVSSQESGMRLVDFLKLKHPDMSMRRLKKMIESNGCMINGRMERFASALVGKGDVIAFKGAGIHHAFTVMPEDVLYDDELLFVYNKPPGMTSESLGERLGLPLIHRLDKETSGVLMFAKEEGFRLTMIQLFKEKKVKKTYLALVDGVPGKFQGCVENYLGKLHAYQGQTLWGAVDARKGLYARTDWHVEKRGKSAALLKCLPLTGRTHQIRVHCSEMGHPILGDYQYGRKFRCSYRAPRCMLHAFEVEFELPFVEKRKLCVRAPIPADMMYAINQDLA